MVDYAGRVVLKARGDWKFPNPKHPERGCTWEEPICPDCGRNNAMLRLRDCENDEVQCRDCGFKIKRFVIEWMATGRIEVPFACMTEQEKEVQRKEVSRNGV